MTFSLNNRMLIIAVFLFAVESLFPAHAEGSSRLLWQKRAASCVGDLSCMLKQVDASGAIAHFRTRKSAEELTAALHTAGRFRQLGLTAQEGRILVDAVYRKMQNPVVKNEDSAVAKELASASPVSALRYRAGQEFERLEGVLMRWPFDWSSQRDEWAEMIDAMFDADVIVYLWVNTLSQKHSGLTFLEEMGVPTEHIFWVVEATNSVWMRDYGPQFVYSTAGDGWGVVDFHYYDSRPQDDDTPVFISRAFRVPRIDRQTKQVVYTEGGNLNHDGLGCVVYSQRTYRQNAEVSPETVDQRILSAFQAHLNLVPEDPSLDGTGHVDMFMKIVGENTVLIAAYEPDQVDYQILEDCAALFANATNGAGEPWHVARIPQPDVYYIYFVLPVVRTYTNSLIVNDIVLLPTYGIDLDLDAAAVYQQLFPEKIIRPIDASVIIESGGAWHCVTMEYPSPVNAD